MDGQGEADKEQNFLVTSTGDWEDDRFGNPRPSDGIKNVTGAGREWQGNKQWAAEGARHRKLTISFSCTSSSTECPRGKVSERGQGFHGSLFAVDTFAGSIFAANNFVVWLTGHKAIFAVKTKKKDKVTGW